MSGTPFLQYLRGWRWWLACCLIATSPLLVSTARAGEQDRYPSLVICDVFGDRYCGQALRVVWCESRFSVNARNGQYMGLFQMGSYERRNYGHGSTVRAQSRAAKRYFVATGRDWSPWSCKP